MRLGDVERKTTADVVAFRSARTTRTSANPKDACVVKQKIFALEGRGKAVRTSMLLKDQIR